MSYPTYREISEEALDLRCDITARGDCCRENKDERVRDLGMQLVINASDMTDGMSNQQKKVGIGVLREWYVEGLKFFGQEPVSDLLPGTFVRVLLPTTKEMDRARYIGVIDSIDGDILVLLTYDEDGNLHDVRIPYKQFVIERINGYTGVADFPRFLIYHHSSTLLPVYLKVAHAALTKRQMQADGMMEKGPMTAESVSGAPMLHFGVEAEHFLDPDTDERRPEDVFTPGEIQALIEGARGDSPERRIDGEHIEVVRPPADEDAPETRAHDLVYDVLGELRIGKGYSPDDFSPASNAMNELLTVATGRRATAISFTREDIGFTIRIHARQMKDPWTLPSNCTVEQLLEFVKVSAGMDLAEDREAQKGSFDLPVIPVGRVRCACETFINPRGENLAIMLVY